MRRTLWLAGVLALVAAAGVAVAGDGTTYGKGVTLDKATSIDQLLADPQPMVGKAVRVDGVVTGVCERRGCWMQVSNPDTGKGIRIKVEDGVIVFPLTASGHRASAEGVLEVVHVSPEVKEKAAAEGHTCTEHAEGEVTYLIRGTGAIIY